MLVFPRLESYRRWNDTPWITRIGACPDGRGRCGRYGPEVVHKQPSDTPAPSAEAIRLFDDADFQWRRSGPTSRTIRAFGIREDLLRRFPGGAGYNWTDGRLVLKPVGYVPEHDWVCEVYAAWDSHGVRVPEPVAPRGTDGIGWSVDGWGAHVWVPGRDTDLASGLPLVKDASDAFHASLRDVPRPDFLDVRNDPWAFGDRVAWEAAKPEGDQDTLEVIRALSDHLAPVSTPGQPIHGDILPNVLVADGLPAAVIDWPVYFRPVGMANAIAVTDALTFRGAPPELLEEWETGEDWNQMLIRALLYRLGATGLIASRNRLMGSLVTHVERVRTVVDEVLSRS
jgi:hypothetical protein